VKPGHKVGAVIQQMYEQTPLQVQCHVSFLALVDGRPQHCSLRRLLREFLTFRETTLQRRYAHEYQEVTEQIQRLQALHTAMTHLHVLTLPPPDSEVWRSHRRGILTQFMYTPRCKSLVRSKQESYLPRRSRFWYALASLQGMTR